MAELTNIQRRVFDFVQDLLSQGRPAPTLREVAAAFQWNSKRTAACHIEAIIRKGWLASEPGKASSLPLTATTKMARQDVVQIPLFGSIPAGFSREQEQESHECIPVIVESIGFKPTRNTFALRVSGDCRWTRSRTKLPSKRLPFSMERRAIPKCILAVSSFPVSRCTN